jgi:malic enzyme
MEQKTVHRLERELEEAIADVVSRLGLSRLPLLPSQQTMHLMSKAAVAVYESAVENHHSADGMPMQESN